jgi:hypothetical protein
MTNGREVILSINGRSYPEKLSLEMSCATIEEGCLIDMPLSLVKFVLKAAKDILGTERREP